MTHQRWIPLIAALIICSAVAVAADAPYASLQELLAQRQADVDALTRSLDQTQAHHDELQARATELEGAERDRWLESVGVERMRRIVDIVEAEAKPWRERSSLLDEPEPKQGWYTDYPGHPGD